MLLWCWRGLLAIWGILLVIKFEDVLSIQFADNIKAVDAWWKDLYYILNNLTDAALRSIANTEVFTGENALGFFSPRSGKKLKSYKKTYLHLINFAGAMWIHTI